MKIIFGCSIKNHSVFDTHDFLWILGEIKVMCELSVNVCVHLLED